MSTWSLLDDKECWNRIETLLDDVPLAENRQVMKRDARNRNAKAGTKGQQTAILVKFAQWADQRDLLKLDEEDIADYFAEFLDQEQSTQYHKFVAVRGFYRRVTKNKNPPQIGDFVVARPKKKRINPKTLVDAKTMQRILRHWRRDVVVSAFFAFLYDSGFRLQEAYNLDVDSVEFVDDVVWVHLPDKKGNKTGPRTVMLVDSIPYLNDLVANHPVDDPSMLHGEEDGMVPLFVQWSRKHKKFMRPTPNWVTFRMKKTREVLDIKILHPHLFRHTAATNMAKRGVQEGDMRRHFGWSHDSDEPSHYAHLTLKNYETSMRRLNGLAPLEEEVEEVLSSKCACGTMNRSIDTRCVGCTRALRGPSKDVKERRKEDELREMVAREVAKLLPSLGAVGEAWLPANKDHPGVPRNYRRTEA